MGLDSPAQAGDTQGPQSKPKGLLDGSGFMDGLRRRTSSLTQSASDLLDKGVKKGKELAHGETAHQVVQTGKDIAHSPTTKRVTGELVDAGKKRAGEDLQQAEGFYAAAKKGDLKGAAAKGLPLAKEAGELITFGPMGVVVKAGKGVATKEIINQAPPGQRANLTRLSELSAVPSLTPAGLVKGKVLEEVVAAGSKPPAAKPPDAQHPAAGDALKTAQSYIKGLGSKLHLTRDADTPPEKRQ